MRNKQKRRARLFPRRSSKALAGKYLCRAEKTSRESRAPLAYTRAGVIYVGARRVE